MRRSGLRYLSAFPSNRTMVCSGEDIAPTEVSSGTVAEAATAETSNACAVFLSVVGSKTAPCSTVAVGIAAAALTSGLSNANLPQSTTVPETSSSNVP